MSFSHLEDEEDMIEDTENASMASMCQCVELCAYVYQMYED